MVQEREESLSSLYQDLTQTYGRREHEIRLGPRAFTGLAGTASAEAAGRGRPQGVSWGSEMGKELDFSATDWQLPQSQTWTLVGSVAQPLCTSGVISRSAWVQRFLLSLLGRKVCSLGCHLAS